MRYSLVALIIVWITVYYRAFMIYRQKLGPEYAILPELRRKHEYMGFLWAGLMVAHIVYLPSLFFWLAPTALLVLITGINLRRNKPTAVFVHFGLGMITSVIACILLIVNF